MAQTDKDPELRFWRAQQYDTHAAYAEPSHSALDYFIEWLHGSYREGDQELGLWPAWMPRRFTESVFYESGEEVRCLYDLAYVWLAETDAVRYCPTFESWMLFLIAFADAVHFFPANDTWDQGITLSYVSSALHRDAEAHGMSASEYARTLDLLYRAPSQRPVIDGEEGTRTDDLPLYAHSYSHPALRRDFYEYAASRARHHMQHENDTK